MSIYQIACPGRVVFLPAELAELEALPDGALQVEPALWCELQAGHAGLHHTFAQGLKGTETEPPRSLWTRWAEDDEYGPEREMVVLPPCPAEFLAGTLQSECCGLPKGHEGRHGFEFGPPITQADVMPDWVLKMFDEE